MKAAGRGFADLYAAGVAKDACEECCEESREGVGLVEPMGSDFEKSNEAGLNGRWKGSWVGDSSWTLDCEED